MRLHPLARLFEEAPPEAPATAPAAPPALKPADTPPPSQEKRRGPGRPSNEERGLPPAERRSHKKKAPAPGGKDWGAIKVRLAKYIGAGHDIAAKLTNTPMLALSKTPLDEAAELSGAVCDIFEQHEIPISPRLLAWLNLAGVLLMVYVPRILIIDYARKVRRSESRVPAGATAAQSSDSAPKIQYS